MLISYFSIASRSQLALLNSLYMVGYAVGPLIWGPLSEHIERRPIIVTTYLAYILFSIACTAAPSWVALLISRLLCDLSAAAPNVVASGLYADIFDQPSTRGLFITSLGPFLAPLISGPLAYISWRWSSWAAAILASPGVPFVALLPETFAPVIYARRNQASSLIYSSSVPDSSNLVHFPKQSAKKMFLRPAQLFFGVPRLLFSCLYAALAYAIMFLIFQAYPIIFEGE